MKIVVLPDKFKGTLSAQEASEAISEGIVHAAAVTGRNDVEIIRKPMADGGEGTLRILVRPEDIVTVQSFDARMRAIDSEIGIATCGGIKHGIIESATSIGLSRLKRSERNPEETTSYGLGVQIRSALEAGCRKLTIAIGGTATNDCGAGMLAALGAKHYYANGHTAAYPCGKDLLNITKIDLCGLIEELSEAEITIMCDVDNPLLGPEGATMTFGRQKGADRQMLQRLEYGAKHYSEILSKVSGKDLRMQAGSGAAGGIGWALSSVSGAGYAAGAATVSKITGISEAVEGASLFVTGEGRCDMSSMHGKVAGYVARLGREHNIPVMVLCGIRDHNLNHETARRAGIFSINAITDHATIQEAMEHPHEELQRMTQLIFEQIL